MSEGCRKTSLTNAMNSPSTSKELIKEPLSKCSMFISLIYSINSIIHTNCCVCRKCQISPRTDQNEPAPFTQTSHNTATTKSHLHGSFTSNSLNKTSACRNLILSVQTQKRRDLEQRVSRPGGDRFNTPPIWFCNFLRCTSILCLRILDRRKSEDNVCNIAKMQNVMHRRI